MEHHIAAHLTELVEQAGGGDDGIVVNLHLAGKLCRVTDDASVADDTVMCHMHILHQQVTIAYDSLSLGGCATADGDIFTDGVVVANLTSRLLTLEFQILRFGGYAGTREEFITIADTGTEMDGDTVV